MSFEKRIERIISPSVDLEVFMVPWDSQIFGFPVAQIERIVLRNGSDPTDAMRQLQLWFDRNDVRLASCRLASDRLHESMLLESSGFRFVEMVYGPVLCPIPAVVGADDCLVVTEAEPEDMLAIEVIAASAFTTGRFIVDWRLDENANHRRYRAWVRNSFDDTQQKVLKATIVDDLVGFFIVEERSDRSVYWHLTAIAPSWQGRGLGKRLWRAMMARHHAAGLQRIVTRISAHNTPVMNLYAGLGFKFSEPQMTFHWMRA